MRKLVKKNSNRSDWSFLRYLADSNRCRWCCRPLPSRSAKVPFLSGANIEDFTIQNKVFKQFLCFLNCQYRFSSVFQPHNF